MHTNHHKLAVWPRSSKAGGRSLGRVISGARPDHTTSMPRPGRRRQLDANMMKLARFGRRRGILDAVARANPLDHVLERLADLPRLHGFAAALLGQLKN